MQRMFEMGKLERGTVPPDTTSTSTLLPGRLGRNPAPSSTATRRRQSSTRSPQGIDHDQGSQRWGGTVPPSTPVMRLPRGITSQTSQTGTELPKIVKSVSQGGGGMKSPISLRSAKPKSVCRKEPEDKPGSHLLVRKLPSKLENLKMFWENSGKSSEQTSAKPKLCRTNGRGALKESFVQTNSAKTGD